MATEGMLPMEADVPPAHAGMAAAAAIAASTSRDRATGESYPLFHTLCT